MTEDQSRGPAQGVNKARCRIDLEFFVVRMRELTNTLCVLVVARSIPLDVASAAAGPAVIESAKTLLTKTRERTPVGGTTLLPQPAVPARLPHYVASLGTAPAAAAAAPPTTTSEPDYDSDASDDKGFETKHPSAAVECRERGVDLVILLDATNSMSPWCVSFTV